jgi:chitodextrinase
MVAPDINVTSIRLIWDSSSDNIGVTGYDIFLNNEKLGFKPIVDTVYQISGLKPSVNYNFKLVAYDFAGNVSDTGSFSVSTAGDIIVPSTPVLYPTTQKSSSEIAINWSNSSDNSNVEYYDLYNKGVLLKGKIPAHEYMGIPVDGEFMLYKVTGLDINTEYEFSLKAVDLSGNESDFSNVLVMKTDSVWSRLLDIEEAYMGIGYLFYYGNNMDLSGFLFGTMMSGYMEWTIDLPKDTSYRFISHFTTEESFTYPMQIDVNGEMKAEYELKRLPDMTWWGYEDDPGFVIADLNAGTSLIRLTSYAKYSPNLDHIKIMYSAPYVHVLSVTLDTLEINLAKNETFKLNATIEPENATEKGLKWTTLKSGVAKVDDTGLVTAIGKGVTSIKVTSIDGSISATCLVSVGLTGIEKIEEIDAVNIYPNPANDEFLVYIKDVRPDEIVEISLFNSLSKMVMNSRTKSSEIGDTFRFDVSTLNNGIYFLRINMGNEIITRKIIVSR